MRSPLSNTWEICWARWLMRAAVAAAVATGAIQYYGRHRSLKPRYTTEKVERRDLTQVVTATGTLNPVLNVTVGSQVSGLIRKLYVDFNSNVKSNQVIAEIDPSTYEAAYEQARADLANAKANAELQRVQANRSSALFTNKLISSSEDDTAVATLHEAEATMQIKEASLRNAAANLGFCKILSPVRHRDLSRRGTGANRCFQFHHADLVPNRKQSYADAD